MNDQEILKLIKTNNTGKAMLELYQSLPVVEHLVLSKGGSKEDAKDIYQEALIIFCRKAKDEQFQLTSAIGTYLYSTCRFLWKDELKKRNKTSFEFDGELSSTEEDNLLKAIEQERKYHLAEEALSTIGDKCLNLLKLFYFEGMRMIAIATKMGFSSEKIAKNQKYKCLERARKKLQELKLNPSI